MSTIPRTGRSAPRSKNGCYTCRVRKIKCDEQRPLCSKCAQAQIKCEWDRALPPRRSSHNHNAKGGGASVRSPPQPDFTSPTASDEGSMRSGTTCDDGLDQSLVMYGNSEITSLSQIVENEMSDLSPMVINDTFEMANSLVLSQHELTSFQYIPESFMVRRFGKPWLWSTVSYVHSRIAPHDCGVMSAFISVASMELRFRELVQYQGEVVSQGALERAANLRSSAAKYFDVAIKFLSSLLDRMSRNEPTNGEIESLFAMWFLILHCELYDPELIRASQIHLNGIRSFIVKYMQDVDGNGTRKLPPSSGQLLLFISYHDANLALGDHNGGQLCLDLMSIPKESSLAYDRIWEEARTCLPKMWGSEYPAEEILDDIENYRGLSFLQACQKIKIHIWQIASDTGELTSVDESRRLLWLKIEEIGEIFMDVLALARSVKGSNGRRVMWTIYHGCLDYFAIKVLYSCLDKDDHSPEWLNSTLSDLLTIAHKSLGEDPQQLYRYSWSLAVALLKVRDPIHRDWIQTQLRKARILLSDVGLPARLIDAPSPPENVFLEYHRRNFIEDIR